MNTNAKSAPSVSSLDDKPVVESHSIDFIPENERTDKLSSQGPFWFLGNFTFFTMTIGFVGPSVGLTALWTTLAGTLGIMFGTLFMAFHGSQGPHLGLPQMIQSRAQFGYRGVILVLLATLFVFARAVQGSRMPLAVIRKGASDLPLQFVLDDSMAMAPGATLSSAREVVIEARLSTSGTAVPASGDLAGESGPVAPGTNGVVVTINRIVP